jgi:uracil-DNA glycosylase family 4
VASEAPESANEARALIASAHALVRELIEEGVTEFPRIPAVGSKRHRSADSVKDSASPNRSEAIAAKEKEIAPVSNPISEAPPWGDRRPELAEVEDHLGDCRRCGLCEGRQSIVFGDGNPEADLMFIGEGPGEQEDLRGLPFVGRAGDLLTQMIEKGIGIPRSEVYICNIVKCRPPRNRNPMPPEVSACRPFLDGQIRAIAPKVIVTLGKPAASLLLGRDVAITRIRGTWQSYQGIPLMPTLHPAYVLRQYTTETRRAVWQDLQAAIERTRT